MQIDDMDETVRRLSSIPGVLAVIVADHEGMPIRTTIDQTSTVIYISRMTSLYSRCILAIREIDPTNELELIRIRSKRFEILATVAPEYTLLIIQSPSNLLAVL